jgi:hypothetical protein
MFTDVYFISRLRSSVISLGQLGELHYDICICCGVLTIHDRHPNLIVKVKHALNRLYKLTMHPVQPLCLSYAMTRPPGAGMHGLKG